MSDEHRDAQWLDDAEPERQSPPRTPRWVLALGLIVLVLVVLIITTRLLLGLQHGPGMH